MLGSAFGIVITMLLGRLSHLWGSLGLSPALAPDTTALLICTLKAVGDDGVLLLTWQTHVQPVAPAP